MAPSVGLFVVSVSRPGKLVEGLREVVRGKGVVNVEGGVVVLADLLGDRVEFLDNVVGVVGRGGWEVLDSLVCAKCLFCLSC